MWLGRNTLTCSVPGVPPLQLNQYRSLLDSLGGAPPTPRSTRTGGGATVTSAPNSRRATAEDIAVAAGMQPNSPAAQVGGGAHGVLAPLCLHHCSSSHEMDYSGA